VTVWVGRAGKLSHRRHSQADLTRWPPCPPPVPELHPRNPAPAVFAPPPTRVLFFLIPAPTLVSAACPPSNLLLLNLLSPPTPLLPRASPPQVHGGPGGHSPAAQGAATAEAQGLAAREGLQGGAATPLPGEGPQSEGGMVVQGGWGWGQRGGLHVAVYACTGLFINLLPAPSSPFSACPSDCMSQCCQPLHTRLTNRPCHCCCGFWPCHRISWPCCQCPSTPTPSSAWPL
jgi:hypothetical protein